MKWLRSAWQLFVKHMGKILSALGTALAAIDLGQLVALKQAAIDNLSPKWSHIISAAIGVAIFVALFARTAWAGIQTSRLQAENQQLKDQLAAQPDPAAAWSVSPLAKPADKPP